MQQSCAVKENLKNCDAFPDPDRLGPFLDQKRHSAQIPVCVGDNGFGQPGKNKFLY